MIRQENNLKKKRSYFCIIYSASPGGYFELEFQYREYIEHLIGEQIKFISKYIRMNTIYDITNKILSLHPDIDLISVSEDSNTIKYHFIQTEIIN